MRYFDHFLAKLETLRAAYRRPTKPVSSVCGRFRPRGESLEDRVVPSVSIVGDPNWFPEGPSPQINAGNTEGPARLGVFGDQDVGSVNALAVDPTNTVHVFAATTNGGIWETENFGATRPVWSTTTDELTSLAIGAIAISPVDTNVIYAGTGSFSAGSNRGGIAAGVYKSTDGGDTWQEFNPGNIFDNLRINRIIPTTFSGGQTVFLSSPDAGGGVFLSNDGGLNWPRVSGTNGLPNTAVSDLVQNPRNPSQFFAAVPASSSLASAGIYMLDIDRGGNWVRIDNINPGGLNITSADLNASQRIQMSISPAGANPIWVSIINRTRPDGMGGTIQGGHLQRVYRGVVSGGTINWLQVGPLGGGGTRLAPAIYGTNNQGGRHGDMLADPTADNLVYLGGDTSSGGANAGYIVRGDSDSNTWTALTPLGTVVNPTTVIPTDSGSTTAPHADTRDFAFAQGRLLIATDGGVYQGTNVRGTTDVAAEWTSVNGSLEITEFLSVAYDNQFDINFGGTQDIGTPSQLFSDSNFYVDESGGDGAAVATDNFTFAAQSVRYFFGITRKWFTSARERPDGDKDGFIVPQAGLNGLPFNLVVGSVINSTAPTQAQLDAGQSTRVVIAGGTNAAIPVGAVYEANNAGSSTGFTAGTGNFAARFFVNNVNWTQIPTGSGFVSVNQVRNGFSSEVAMAYGGRRGGVDNPDVLYAASGNQIFLRNTAGGTLTATNAQPMRRNAAGTLVPAGNITAIVLDPDDWRTAYVTDNDDVYMTTDAGNSWAWITGNLTNRTAGALNARLALIPGAAADALLFGGSVHGERGGPVSNGVFRMRTDVPGVWAEFGELPNAIVGGMVYDRVDDELVVSTYGRGIWTVSNASDVAFGPVSITVTGDENGVADDVIDIQRNPAFPQLLEIIVNGQLQYSGLAQEISRISVNPGNGHNTITVYDLPSGTVLTLSGGNGIDDYIIGGGAYEGRIRGDGITIHASTGFDSLTIDNQNDPTDDLTITTTYTLELGVEDVPTFKVLTTPSFVGAMNTPIGFFGVDSVTINGSKTPNEAYDLHSVGAEITINGSSGSDTFNLFDSDAPVVLNGGSGQDTFHIGAGNYLLNILGEVTVDGGSGADVMSIEDDEVVAGFGALGQLIEDEYTLESRTFSKKATITFFGGPEPFETPVLTFDSIAEVTLNASGSLGPPLPETPPSTINVDSLVDGTTLTINANDGDDIVNYSASAENATVTLNGGSGNDAINVNRSGTGASITANGNDDDDAFGVGNGNYETKIRGAVTVDGGLGEDHLQIDDSTNDITGLLDDHRFSTSPDDPSLGQYVLFQNAKPFAESETLSFRSVQSVELLANDFSNDILVDGTVAGATYTLNGNGGSDEFFVGDGEFNANIGGPLTIDGGDGSDDITVNDTIGGSGIDNYTFSTSTTMTKPGRTLTYLSVEDFTLNAGPGDNAINVHRLLSSVRLEINAGGGDDRINIGLGDFNTQIEGPVTVDAGEHTLKDTITISDSSDGPGGDSYTFDRSDDGSTFAKPGRTLTYNGVEDFVLHASPNADTIAIDALPDLVNLTLNGNQPGTVPGDSLAITGDPEGIASFTPGSAGAGEIVIGGLTVDYTGIEGPLTASDFSKLTLVADNRFDDLWIRDDGDGFTSVSEHLDPAALATLRFTDVGEFVLDGSAIDVSSDWTIEAGALGTGRLGRLELQTGSDLTLVADYTLEGPATDATIAVRSLVGGATQHLVHGTATRLLAGVLDQNEEGGAGKFAILVGLSAAGEAVYFLEDEGVNNLVLIDRQADVELFLSTPDAKLIDGGGLLIAMGTNMTNVWLPAAADGRIRVAPVRDMTVDIQATIFPHFQFDPIYGLDLSPIGVFHLRPVFHVRDAGAGSLRHAIELANTAPADGTAVVFFAFSDTDPAFVDVDSHLGGDVNADAFVLAPLTELPTLTRGNTIINGASQQAATDDTNPFGPEIVLSGHRAAAGQSIHDLVSLYRLDGSIEDIAGDNEPSATAGVSFVDGRLGQGATFAPGGFIDIPHSDNLANQVFTLSAWVRPDGPGPNDDFFGSAIVAKGLSPALGGNQVVSAQLTYSTQLNRFLFGFGDFFSDATRIISADTFAPGQFYHVAATYDGVTFRLYVNGLLQGEKALVKTIEYDPTIPWTIGSAAPPFRAVGFPRTLNGVIDEVGIYNRALSVEEIKSLAKVSAGGPIDGLRLASFGNLVHGLNIQGFSGNGVLVEGDNNRLTGNSIGTSATGDASVANGGDGIHIVDGRGNLIGGLTDADRNVVSGNAGSGVAIQGGFKNIIRGNYIGTTADGTAALGNHGTGIAIRDSAANLIGGDTAEARNVISANGTGVSIVGTLAGENRVSANYIGVAADGSTDLGNFDGVFVGGESIATLGAAGNIIGGSLPGERNVISGNFRSNIFLSTMGTRVQGNYIGTDSTGARQVESDPRSVTGIRLEDDKNSLIGGLLPEEGNLISGHEVGIQFNGQWVAGGLENVRVQGNRIGTTADGEQILANRWGLYMTGHVDSDGVTHLVRNVQIGGTEDGAGNLISGNTIAGIFAFGPGVQGLRIEGNRIGTDVDGDEVVRNSRSGVFLQDVVAVTIGGVGPLAGNLIAGNGANGITIVGGSGHVIQSNLIGTNAYGNFKLGNLGHGIAIENSSGNSIGGSPKGDGNVVAFNGGAGIALTGVSGGTVAGNFVGTDRLGRFLGNAGDGISFHGSSGVQIVDNAVGANAGTGLLLVDSSGNDVLGNAIGSTRLVKPLLPNTVGLRIQGGGGNTIDGNFVSGNTQIGVHLAASSGNTLSNNWIGVADDGGTPIGNDTGVVIAEASSNTFQGNTISGNVGSGVELAIAAEGNRFFGNRIGTSADGLVAIGNGGFGVLIGKGSSRNIIGIERDENGNDDPAQANTIAFNALAGVAVIGEGAVGNTLRGNSIHSNGDLGIDLGADLVTANDYGDPKAKPDPIPPDLDLGPNNLQNYPDIQQVTATKRGIKILGQLHSVPGTSFIIDFYASGTDDPSGHGEGRRWLGSKTIATGIDGGVGAITFDILPVDAAVGEFITATATNTVTGDTSEFSAAVLIIEHGGDRLLAASAPGAPSAAEVLTIEQVQPLLLEAAARWNALPSFDVRIANLPGLTLGLVAGNTIWLDADAAGWGWFVDPTPRDDSEFTTAGDQGEQHRIDLLSVLMHELGHLLGHDHDEGGVMAESLAAGERLTPGGVYVDGRDWFLAPAEGDDGFPHPKPRRHGR